MMQDLKKRLQKFLAINQADYKAIMDVVSEATPKKAKHLEKHLIQEKISNWLTIDHSQTVREIIEEALYDNYVMSRAKAENKLASYMKVSHGGLREAVKTIAHDMPKDHYIRLAGGIAPFNIAVGVISTKELRNMSCTMRDLARETLQVNQKGVKPLKKALGKYVWPGVKWNLNQLAKSKAKVTNLRWALIVFDVIQRDTDAPVKALEEAVKNVYNLDLKKLAVIDTEQVEDDIIAGRYSPLVG